MERMIAMPHSNAEEEFVLRYRRQLEAQSVKQMVQPLERDENGVAFSAAEGRVTASGALGSNGFKRYLACSPAWARTAGLRGGRCCFCVLVF